MLDIAKQAGFMILADDLKKAQSDHSEEKLEEWAGGLRPTVECAFLWIASLIVKGKNKLRPNSESGSSPPVNRNQHRQFACAVDCLAVTLASYECGW